MKRQVHLYITVAIFSTIILPVGSDMDIPPFAKKILEQKGITIADLENDPELRKKWLSKFREMGGKEVTDKTTSGLRVNLNPSPQFYKVIAENNLFRPLGYRKAKPGPPFELIATVVNHGPVGSKALIRSNANQQVYYVGVGEEFAGAKIETIEPLKVNLLHHGKSQEFRVSRGEFLGGGGGEGQRPHWGRNRESAPKSERNDPNFGRRPPNFEGMEGKLRDLPPEARRKFMREMMRKRRAASGGKRRETHDKEREEKERRDDDEEKEKDERRQEKSGK